MEEKNGVLIQNEKQANRAVAKVMRITFLIFTLVYLLNVFGIFVVDMGIMTLAYVAGRTFVGSYVARICGKTAEELREICADSLRCCLCHDCGIYTGISCGTFVYLCDCYCKSLFFKKTEYSDYSFVGYRSVRGTVDQFYAGYAH